MSISLIQKGRFKDEVKGTHLTEDFYGQALLSNVKAGKMDGEKSQ